MDSWERFDETKLSPIEKFYSSLSASSISPEDYEHAQKVWKTFKCKILGDYHDLYLKTDVNLLADVFENFFFFFYLCRTLIMALTAVHKSTRVHHQV